MLLDGDYQIFRDTGSLVIELPRSEIKHLPAVFQVNVGRPLGPYLKASLGLFTRYDNFQRDPDTGPRFVTPVDTFTDGSELRLVGNYKGFNATAADHPIEYLNGIEGHDQKQHVDRHAEGDDPHQCGPSRNQSEQRSSAGR